LIGCHADGTQPRPLHGAAARSEVLISEVIISEVLISEVLAGCIKIVIFIFKIKKSDFFYLNQIF